MEADPATGGVIVEVRGLSVYTHHGVKKAEREVGQRLEINVRLVVEDCGATRTDRLADTVDYSAVCDVIVQAATERSYRTLERLCEVIAGRLAERPGCKVVRVRAAKPEPPIAIPVAEVAVELERGAVRPDPVVSPTDEPLDGGR